MKLGSDTVGKVGKKCEEDGREEVGNVIKMC